MDNDNINFYLDSLPNDIKIINLESKNLKELPDLSRFTNLEILNCSENKLTSIPRLNNTLEILYCDNNKLKNLPKLNDNLEILCCDNNKLKNLPQLNNNLRVLYCSDNYLDSLPKLNDNLKILHCNNNKLNILPLLNNKILEFHFYENPIYDVIGTTDINTVKRKLSILNKFKNMYYYLKFKKKFRDILWIKIREPKIRKQYSPENLIKLLSTMNDENDEDEFYMLIENW
jgi:hypothetical protein